MTVFGHETVVHRHGSGRRALNAAVERQRNTTIVIGADQAPGILYLDIDVQADVCADTAELREQLLLIIEALTDAVAVVDVDGGDES